MGGNQHEKAWRFAMAAWSGRIMFNISSPVYNSEDSIQSLSLPALHICLAASALLSSLHLPTDLDILSQIPNAPPRKTWKTQH